MGNEIKSTYSTKETAVRLGVKPKTVSQGFWRSGHYCGLRPIKMANRFLRWNAAEVDKLAKGVQQ